MRKFLVTALFINTITFITPAFAIPPTRASLQKLAEIEHYQVDLLKGWQKGFVAAFQKSVMSNPSIARLSESKKQQVVQLNNQISQQMVQEINNPEFGKKITQIYLEEMAKTYTQEEVETMISFHGKYIEQKFTKKQDIMLASFIKRAEQGDIISKTQIDSILRKYQPTYCLQLQQIINK